MTLREITNAFAMFVLLIIACFWIVGCERSELRYPEYQDHMNSIIISYCDIYRSSDTETQEYITNRIEMLLKEYSGRIDRDTEYCLNSMDIERR